MQRLMMPRSGQVPLEVLMHTGETAAADFGTTAAAVCEAVRGDGIIFSERDENPDAAPAK